MIGKRKTYVKWKIVAIFPLIMMEGSFADIGIDTDIDIGALTLKLGLYIYIYIYIYGFSLMIPKTDTNISVAM